MSLKNLPPHVHKHKQEYTRGDQKVRGKVLLNRIAFIDSNENS